MKKNNQYSARIIQLSKGLLGEAEEGAQQGSYEEFFQSALEKFGVSSPEDLDDDKKDEFFNYVDANWDAGENETDVDEASTGGPKSGSGTAPKKMGSRPKSWPKKPKREADIPDSPDADDFEDNMEDDPDPESAIRELIRNEIRSALSESVADEDLAKAQSLGKDVDRLFSDVESLWKKIDKELSDFNSPGFKAAIKNAFKIGFSGQDFNKSKASKILTSYLKR